MSDYHAYILYEINQAVVLTNADKRGIKTALRGMGRQNDPSPAKITQFRPDLSEHRAILELTVNPFVPLATLKADAFQRIANATQYNLTQVTSNSTFTLFKPGGVANADVTWEQSRLATIAYLIDNIAEWEEVV